MLDRITSIEVFLSVARHGSFSKAAQSLDMSRAMVSKHVKALEEKLGVRLFNRNTRSIHLTEAGNAYRARVHPLIDGLTDIETNIADMGSRVAGTLAVTAPTTFGTFHLSPLVASYMADFPDVLVQLMLTDRSVNLIEEGFDVGIQIRELDDSSLVARRLQQVDVLTCAAPSYLAAHGEPRHPRDLSAHKCLGFAEAVHTDHVTWIFNVDGAGVSIDVEAAMISNQGDALRIAAIAGRGVVNLPGYIVADDIAAGRLVHILSPFSSHTRPIYVVYPHREYLGSKVRTFVDYLAEVLGR